MINGRLHLGNTYFAEKELQLEKETKYAIIVGFFFALSLVGAVVLFSTLESYAEVVSPPYRLGGAIAGFFVIFTILFTSYSKLLAKPPSELIKEAAKAITKPKGFHDYRSVDRGFSIYYPKKWEVTEDMKMEVMFRRKDGSNLNILTQKASKKVIREIETDPSDYIESVEKLYEMLFKDWRVLKKTTTALHGIQCPTCISEQEVDVDGRNVTLRLFQVVYLDVKGEKLHFISWTASNTEYDDLKPLFEKILSTFQII